MQRVYSLTDEQCTRIDEWSNSHDCRYRCGVKHHTKSPIGGEISITFTPTDVGTIVSAQCICGKKLLFRDLVNL